MSDAGVLALFLLMMAGLAGLAFVALTAWRPAIGCGLFALSIPLTTGLGRGTIIPLLRPNEAILLMLLAGLGLYHLPRRPRRPVTGLDLAVGSFAIGVVVIAVLVLFLSFSLDLHDFGTLRNVLAPAQFFLIYLVFARTELSGPGRETVLNLTMLASVIVGLVAIAELANLPGVRAFMAAYYPAPVKPPGWDPIYRPESTLGHYSAVGAFGALNYTLALSLATARHPAFSRVWLSLVMAVNLAALVASLTWAPLLVMPLLTVLVLWHGRRVPPELGLSLAALALALLLFWPAVNARGAQQGVATAGQGLVIPQTFQFRLNHWEEFFLPALADHVWLGTGTLIPSAVPDRLLDFVDNEYLREAFRAGVVGLALLAIMLVTIAAVGWRSRASPDPMRRSLGGAGVALVVFFALIGMTAEYLFFGGVTQEFAMMLGLLGAMQPAPAAAPDQMGPAPSPPFASAGARPTTPYRKLTDQKWVMRVWPQSFQEPSV
jgi:O-antigen ligase